MSAHAYHPHCGCNACGDLEEADERRDEAIDAVVPAIAKRLVGAEDFAWGVLVDLPDAAQRSVLQDVGRFFERYHALTEDDTRGAMELARALYLELLPQVQAAATEQAREEAEAAYDRAVAA